MRSAHQEVTKSREYIEQGYDWVVDIDLEKFFDRVNHDVLMARIAKDKGQKSVATPKTVSPGRDHDRRSGVASSRRNPAG